MQRPTYPTIRAMRPTGRRLEEAECHNCNWTFSDESPIQQAARQHSRDNSHVVYVYRAQEYIIEPSTIHKVEYPHG